MEGQVDGLLCTPVAAALDPQHVAEVRAHPLCPRGVGRFAPFRRAHDFQRVQVIERDIPLGAAGATVAAGAQYAGDRAQAWLRRFDARPEQPTPGLLRIEGRPEAPR